MLLILIDSEQQFRIKFMKTIYFLLATILFFASCVPQRKIVYFQSENEKKEYDYLVESKRIVKIEPFDLLYIGIGSADQSGYNFFNQEKQNFNSVSEQSLSVLGYTVSDSGYIQLPILGKIKVQGLTLDQASSVIKEYTKNVLTNPIVSIRFVNNTVTILGEVDKPGTYTYTKGQLTIFNALGLANDITEYGNRRKVAVIRETNKTIHKSYLDLTTDDIFKSDYYYLRPNDVLYVEPLRIRRFGMKEYPFTLVVSSITSAFLILYYVKK